MPQKTCTAAFSGFVLLSLVTSLHGQVIRPLNPPTGGLTSYAQSINFDGLVVGYSTTSASVDLPTLWRPGTGGVYSAESLPLPAGMASGAANAISSTGIIAGYAQPSNGATAAAVLWTPTGPGGAYVATTLTAPAGMNYNAAYAVNAAGVATGFGGSSTGGSVAMAWTPAGAVPLPPVASTAAGFELLAGGINDAGDVAGYGMGPALPLTSFVWRPDGTGGYVRKTVIAATDAAVTAINRYGTGAGVYADDQPLVMSFYEGDYYATSLPVPYGSSDGASDAVNNFDGIVGYAKDPSSTVSGPEAAFWIPTDSFWDYVNLDGWLNLQNRTLGRQWRLTEATGINDAWLVVGNATFSQAGNADVTGLPRGFVLDISAMVPEPSLVVLLVAAAPFILTSRARRARRADAGV
jgi:hypothetical protein